jgi:hypothetical protein
MISSFSDAAYLILGGPHPLPGRALQSNAPRGADHAFFEKTQFQRLLGHDLLEIAGFTTQVFDFVGRGRAGGIASQPPFPGFQEVLGSLVVNPLGNPLTAAKLSNAIFATQAIQHDPDLLFS